MSDIAAEWKEWIESEELREIRKREAGQLHIQDHRQFIFVLDQLSSGPFGESSIKSQITPALASFLRSHPDWKIPEEPEEDDLFRTDYMRWDQKGLKIQEKFLSSRDFRRFQKEFSDYEKKMAGRKKLYFAQSAEMLTNAIRISSTFYTGDEIWNELCTELMRLISTYPKLFRTILLNSSLYALDHRTNGSLDAQYRRNSTAAHLLQPLLISKTAGVVLDEKSYLEHLADLLARSTESETTSVFNYLGTDFISRSRMIRELEQKEDPKSGDEKTENAEFRMPSRVTIEVQKEIPFAMPGEKPVRHKSAPAVIEYSQSDDSGIFTDNFAISEDELLNLSNRQVSASRKSMLKLRQETDAIRGYLSEIMFRVLQAVLEDNNRLLMKPGAMPDIFDPEEATRKYQQYYRKTGYPLSAVLGFNKYLLTKVHNEFVFMKFSMLEQFAFLFSTVDDFFDRYYEWSKKYSPLDELDRTAEAELMLYSGPIFTVFMHLAMDLLYEDPADRMVSEEVREVLGNFILSHPEAENMDAEFDTLMDRQMRDYIDYSQSYLTSEEIRMILMLYYLFRLPLSDREKKKLISELLGCLNPPAKRFRNAVKDFMEFYDYPGFMFQFENQFRHDSAILFLAAMLIDPFFLAVSTPYWALSFVENQSSLTIGADGYGIFNYFCGDEEEDEEDEEEEQSEEEQNTDAAEDQGKEAHDPAELWNDHPVTGLFASLNDRPLQRQTMDRFLDLWTKETGGLALRPYEFPGSLPQTTVFKDRKLTRFWKSLENDSQTAEIWKNTPDEIKGMLLYLFIDRLYQIQRNLAFSPTGVFEKGNSENRQISLLNEISLLSEKLNALKEEADSIRESSVSVDTDQIVESAYSKGYKSAKNEDLDEIRQLKNRIAKLEKEKQNWDENRNELAILRSAVFNPEESEESGSSEIRISKEEEQELRDFFAAHEVIIVGGHERLLRALSQKYGLNRVFNNETTDTDIFSQADIAFLMPKFMNHSMFYKAMSVIERREMDTLYLNFRNLEITERKILEYIRKYA